jgi:L-ascorbate metabolism protein UlaG (beta-lactamase superfamily)
MRATVLLFMSFLAFTNLYCQNSFEKDKISTSEGELEIVFIGHGTLYFTFNEKVIHIDPVNQYADYSVLPKADVILITHDHGDHFQTETIDQLIKKNTELVFTGKCASKYHGEGIVANNGDVLKIKDIDIEVVPAYNLKHLRDNGSPYHAKGEGNGYILRFGDNRVYIAGDTENFPEMIDIKDIDIAFLPMNLPYTMTPDMVVSAVDMIKPKVLYPYHYGNTDTNELLKLMKGKDFCEVKIRKMK